MKSIFSLMLLIGLSVLVTACGGTPTAGAATPTIPAPVKDNGNIKAEGKLQPVQFVNLSFASGGEVTEVVVKEGDTVKAGDVIARTKSDLQQAAVASAEAGVAEAKASEAKYREQLPQQIASAEAQIQAARAAITGTLAQRNDPAAIASAEAALLQAQVKQQAAEDAHKKVIDKGM